MKSLFAGDVREELVARIAALRADSRARWGRMDAHQMLKHCALFDEWVQGVHAPAYFQSFLGRIFGRLALKSVLRDEAPLRRNSPAGAGFVVRDTGGDAPGFELDRRRWSDLIGGYARYSNPAFIHDFFGKMTEEQIGRFAYKHADHHLRQFGC